MVQAKGANMPTYVTLIKFTDQGARAIHQTAERAAAFKEEAATAGVTVKQIYWTMGGFDGLLILQAKSEEAAAAVLFDLAAKGNVHTQTMRAFEENEIRDLVGRERSQRSGNGSRQGGRKK
jgi:uncharacterized protein with GYD domain